MLDPTQDTKIDPAIFWRRVAQPVPVAKQAIVDASMAGDCRHLPDWLETSGQTAV